MLLALVRYQEEVMTPLKHLAQTLSNTSTLSTVELLTLQGFFLITLSVDGINRNIDTLYTEKRSGLSTQPCGEPVHDGGSDIRMAIETLYTATAVIKQSRVSNDKRCRMLVNSLNDCLNSIETKCFPSKRHRSQERASSRSRERYRERSSSTDRERDRERERERGHDREHRDRH
ncbi:cleavage and polyadenylation specificity factor subunit 6 isoform X1 [Tachysurus ichikawai]